MRSKMPGAIFALLLACLMSPGFAAGLEDIANRGSVRIGVADFAPWTFTNRGDQLEGFEIDLGRMIGHDLGVKPEFKLLKLDDAFRALRAGEIDFIAAGLAITPQRAREVEFSIPYFRSGITLVTNRKKLPVVSRLTDLNRNGTMIAVVANTLSANLAQQLFDSATVKTLPDGEQARRELLEGRVHALLTSVPDANILARANAAVVQLPLSQPIVSSVAGFAVKPGNQQLLNFLNAWISSRQADGSLSQSYGYWFDNYDWTVHMK